MADLLGGQRLRDAAVSAVAECANDGVDAAAVGTAVLAGLAAAGLSAATALLRAHLAVAALFVCPDPSACLAEGSAAPTLVSMGVGKEAAAAVDRAAGAIPPDGPARMLRGCSGQ